MLRPAPVLQSDYRQAGRPSSPSEERRPGFSIRIGPVQWRRAFLMYDTSPDLYIRVKIPLEARSAPGGSGSIGPDRSRLSGRRELLFAGFSKAATANPSRARR